jgi:hypothetical protein
MDQRLAITAAAQRMLIVEKKRDAMFCAECGSAGQPGGELKAQGRLESGQAR